MTIENQHPIDDLLLLSDTELVSIFGNRDTHHYWHYIQRLRDEASESVFDKACQLINTNNTDAQCIGIDILAQFNHRDQQQQAQMVQLFFETLKKSKDNEVRSAALHAIGHHNVSLVAQEIEQLCRIATNTTEEKSALIFALLGLNHTSAIAQLIELSCDSSVSVRDWATFGLGTQIDNNTPEIINALWKRTADTHQQTREEAIFGLAKRGDKRVIPLLETAIYNHHFSLCLLDAMVYLQDDTLLTLLEEKKIQAEKHYPTPPDYLGDLIDCIDAMKQ